MPVRINQQLHALHSIVTELRRRTPAALANASNIVADGYPAGGSGGGSGKNTISDPTARAALNRTGSPTHVADKIAAIERSIATSAAQLAHALALIDSLLPSPGTTPRCSGGAGLDGHLDWGDPTCTNIPDGRPSYQGMCNACWQRQRRWQREPRTDRAA